MVRRWLSGVLAAVLLLAGCSSEPDPHAPPEGFTAVDEAANRLIDALAAGDVSHVPMQQAASDAQDEFKTVYSGMDGLRPLGEMKSVTYVPEERAANVTLAQAVQVGEEPWTFETSARFLYVNDEWRLEWSPKVLHPQLDPNSRIRRIVERPGRAPIRDREGTVLMEEMTLYEIGIDKGRIDQADWEKSARALAKIVNVDADKFAARVKAGGAKQFVVSITLRQQDIPAEVSEVPGVLVNEVQRTVSPFKGFAESILGRVGQPTAEMIEKSDGVLTEKDSVGLSGLQARYNDQLAGEQGVRVELVARKKDQEAPVETQNLYDKPAKQGTALKLSLSRPLQEKAEELILQHKGVASIVAIDLATGGVTVAANSADAGVYPYATTGKYAPGSTFKMVTALAMLRKGQTASSTVNCAPEHKVATYTFKNYSGYSRTGNIPLSDAIAYSCNTVFTKASESLSAADLQAAAGSLGVGTDYDVGFPAYFGTVDPKNAIDLAASSIGQGQVTMSPLGMATVAASVAKGQTVIPWMVEGHTATPKAAPLTQAEAAELQKMMAATVGHGTGKMLKGIVKGAKTGTAQFGPANQQQTHAWMIAYTDTTAIAAFVEVGDSGGTAAAPLIKALLTDQQGG